MPKKIIATVLDSVDDAVTKVESRFEETVRPVRQSALRRFPVLFFLLVTFGVVATFLGIERIIADIAWLNDRPVFIFIVGVATLVMTGTLYKKLG